jgi:hypothetical protein
MTLTTNESWPGPLPPGTKVELVRQTASSVFVRVGRRIVKASPAWLDWPESEPFAARGLRTNRIGVMG